MNLDNNVTSHVLNWVLKLLIDMLFLLPIELQYWN